MQEEKIIEQLQDQKQASDSKKNLNLARKWRPQTFDHIVGQSIPIRMLKNSLYLKKFFPVYLFAGQRGCGKTTTARVFAAATNCHNLEKFRLNPTAQQIPCLTCPSCIAMGDLNHPDFIEIDAASHTGVDNVRQIIETSSYMPLSGQKKIYLIDEAHMLSKSAFNAFLKILEDPPASALFLLATTELNKFPETVLSRCFQLTFGPLKTAQLKPYLKELCSNELINIEDDALDALIEETDGSARDALNLLEQVRMSHSTVTADAVLNVLGKVSNTIPIQIFEHIIEQNPHALLTYLQTISFTEIAPQALWSMLAELCRALLWVKYGVQTLPNNFNKNITELQILAEKCSINKLYNVMQLLWTQEPLFLQTSNKHTFVELVLLQLCQNIQVQDLNKSTNTPTSGPRQQINKPTHTPITQAQPVLPAKPQPNISQIGQTSPTKQIGPKQTAQIMPAHANTQISAETPDLTTQPSQPDQPARQIPLHNEKWLEFTQKISTEGNDNMLTSIFSQAAFIEYNQDNAQITLQLSNNSKFLHDKIEDSKKVWEPFITQIFTKFSRFNYATPPPGQHIQKKEPAKAPILGPNTVQNSTGLTPKSSSQHAQKTQTGHKDNQDTNINITDKEKWPLANLIIAHFPGIIKKIKVYN